MATSETNIVYGSTRDHVALIVTMVRLESGKKSHSNIITHGFHLKVLMKYLRKLGTIIFMGIHYLICKLKSE